MGNKVKAGREQARQPPHGVRIQLRSCNQGIDPGCHATATRALD